MSTGGFQLCQSPIVGGPVASLVSTLVQGLLAAHCALTIPSTWPEDYGPTVVTNGHVDPYDFVLVGASGSGAALASRLSENPNWKVLLLENGGDPPSESEVPAMLSATYRGSHIDEYDTTGETQACQGTKKKQCYWPVPKLMGGSSSIDLTLSFRGNKEKFETWGLDNWSFQNVSRFYDISESFGDASSAPSGSLIVKEYDQYDEFHISEMILHGGKELGLEWLRYPRGNSKVGYGFMRGHVEKGRRMGAGKSFLSPVKARSNLQVIKNAQITKLNFGSDKSVQSVAFQIGTRTFTVEVKKEAILAGGVIGNAKLLMLSGIGPKDELMRNGITEIVDSPDVGQNLQDLISVPVVFKIQESTASPKTLTEIQTDTFFYLNSLYGPLNTIGLAALNGFINGKTSCAFTNCRNPDLSLTPFFSHRSSGAMRSWYTALDLNTDIVKSLDDANKEAHLLLTFVTLHDPESVGSVELGGNNPSDKMILRPNYLSADSDKDKLLQGIKFQMELERTRAYKRYKAEIMKLDIAECNSLTFKSDAYWRCYIKYMTQTFMAPSGTTRMGDDDDAVVDLELKVNGVGKLRVIGSSVLPSPILGSDTGVMVSENLAAILRKKWNP